MQKIPEAEARALLAKPLVCEDCSDWEPDREQPGTFAASAGLLDADGANVGMYVLLLFRPGVKTNRVRYIFTVFRVSRWGPERVYQLDVSKWRVLPPDLHQWAHEHWGAARNIGDRSWAKWTYDDAIRHFCQATGIDFRPPVEDPEHFKLKG